MILNRIILFLGILFLCSACSSDSAKKTENAEASAIKQEVQTLDSLSNNLDESSQEIENSTKALEEAINDLDDL